ncbi:MAG: DNA-3-methyladenine glycosylase [Chloroflexota bacterium]|nr:DNA-3-methyladenine glycosylase [Chloroflexota bacterium]
MSGPPDPRAILERSTLEVARGLLGWRLVRDDAAGRRVGRIVELEAYIGQEDRASHARFGRTARNEIMYGLPGRAYVYLVYGMHDCLNIVTEPAGSPAALLVRAIEPLEGIERMRASSAERTRARRRTPKPTGRIADARLTADTRIAAGPGLVCAAFDLDRTLTGHDLFDPTGAVRLEPPPPGEASPTIVTGPRIGIGYAGAPWTDVPWRLSIAGHLSVSRPLPQRAG